MLMQSALSCDTRRFLGPSYYRGLSPTPPPSSDSISSGLLGVSRRLQGLLNVSPAPTLSTPPRPAVRLASPFHQENKTKSKPKTRSRKTPPKINTPRASTAPRTSTSRATTPRASSRAKTPTTPPPMRKRSRSVYEDSDNESDKPQITATTSDRRLRNRYNTPKRQRHFPYHMPLGLGISDFESLQTCSDSSTKNQMFPEIILGAEALPQLIIPSIEIEDTSSNTCTTNNLHENDTFDEKTDWTAEEDEQLVDMVLEKFKLTKRDWEDCARRIGKDDASVGRRWQALLGEGNVGLRRGSGQFVRGRLDGCFEQT